MRLFTMLVISVLFVWTWATLGIVEALLVALVCGCVLFIVFTAVDLILWLEDRIWQRRHLEISIRGDEQQEDIVDAEIVDERDEIKWWRV